MSTTHLLRSLLGVKHDGESNELRMRLHQILNPPLLQILTHVLLQMKNDTSSTFQASVLGSLGNGERPASLGSPRVALIVVVLGDDLHLIGHEVGRVETHTELSNHGDIRPGRKSLHKGLRSRFGNSSKIVHKISLGHTNTRILNGKSVVGLIGDQLDLELGLRIKDGRVRKRLVANLVEGIGRVGDELAKEDLFVGVEGVDDEGEKLVDVCREGVGFLGVGHVVVVVVVVGGCGNITFVKFMSQGEKHAVFSRGRPAGRFRSKDLSREIYGWRLAVACRSQGGSSCVL
jgi:hypothetical protein